MVFSFLFFFFSPSRWCPHGVFDTMQGLPHTFLSGSPDHLLSLTLISLGLYLIWGQIFLVYFLHFFFIFSRNLGYIWGLPHNVGSTAGSKFDFECVKLLEFRFVQEFVFILMMIHSVIIAGMGTFKKKNVSNSILYHFGLTTSLGWANQIKWSHWGHPGVSEVHADRTHLLWAWCVHVQPSPLIYLKSFFFFLVSCNSAHASLGSIFPLLAKTSASYRESLVISHNDLVSPDTHSHMGRLWRTAGYQLRP